MRLNSIKAGEQRDQKRYFRFGSYSLRTKLLVALIFFSAVSTILMAWASVANAREALKNQARQSLLNAGSQTANSLNDFFITTINAVETDVHLPIYGEYLSSPIEMRSDELQNRLYQAFQELLLWGSEKSSQDPRLNALESISLIDQHGEVVADSSLSSLLENQSSEDYFINSMQNPQTYISQVRLDPDGQSYFYLAHRILNHENQPAGVLLARYKASVFQRIIEDNKDLAGTGSFAILVDGNGLRLGQGVTSEALYRTVGTNGNNMSEELADLSSKITNLGNQTIFSFQLGLGKEVFQAAKSSLGSPLEAWQVFYVQSDQTLMAPLTKIVRNTVLLAFLLILLSVFAAIPLSSSLTAPIRKLMEVTKAISSGDMNSRAQLDADDEFGILAGAINQMTSELHQNMINLEQRVSERTRDLEKRSNQLQAVAEIGRAAATIRNVDELLSTVTRLISERFGFYHAGIFLLEEQDSQRKDALDEKGIRYAVLRAANSEGGQRMLARGHKLRVGQQGIVGYVTGSGNPRIALDVGDDSKFFNNPDLLETRSEMALALSSGGKIIGALDVQSTQPNAFSREEAAIMQTLADLVAIAIENARLFRESNEALETSRRVYGEISRRSWMEILNQRAELSYTSLDYLSSGGSLDQGLSAVDGNDGETAENIVREESQGNYPLSLPIKVRETVIGYLDTFKPKESGGWTPEEYDMVTTIIEQLGVALESARLYEASQLQAERERLVGEVASRMRESLDVDAVLRTAVQELRQSLGISQVEVRLKSSQQDERG